MQGSVAGRHRGSVVGKAGVVISLRSLQSSGEDKYTLPYNSEVSDNKKELC